MFQRRFVAIFGSATILGQLAQVGWLVAGSRALTRLEFGTILSVQALYGLLQFAVDNGSALEGARRAAAGTLDARGRASIVRLRLQLAVAGAAAMLGISAIAGSRAVAAASTYALAVVLFALLRYWEPFGRGSSEPWASYIVLRSAAPALAAAACLVASTRFPLPLAGAADAVGAAVPRDRNRHRCARRRLERGDLGLARSTDRDPRARDAAPRGRPLGARLRGG